MIRLLQHSTLVIAFLGITLFQKMDWEWRVAGLPPGPPSQCIEIVLPPLPTREAWLPTRVDPHTQPRSPMEGASLQDPVGEAEFYTVTGYAVGDPFTPGQVTADGRLMRPGITVACPEELTLGTMLYIQGIGGRVCEDRGLAIIGKRLDVAFETPEAAMMFGKRQLAVVVIR